MIHIWTGGGKIKIENKKLEYKVTSRIAAKNDNYKGPAGGEKKVKWYELINVTSHFQLDSFDYFADS